MLSYTHHPNEGCSKQLNRFYGFWLKLFSVLVQTKPESTNLEQGGGHENAKPRPTKANPIACLLAIST